MSHHPVSQYNHRNAWRMRGNMPDAELKFWNAVRGHRLMGVAFRRQMPIAGYLADFACPAYKLIVEIDGPSHSFDDAIRRDGQRDRALAELGWQVLHVTNEDVLLRLDEVCTHIVRMTGVGDRD